jgi:6-phosphogluconolactonase
MPFVYVSNALSGDISVLALDAATGAITPVQTVAVGGRMGALALSPDRRFLYAARRSDPLAVVGFRIDASDGRLAPLGEAALPAAMAYIVTDHTGRYLLSASYAGSLLTVSPIGADGRVGEVQQTLPTPPKAHAIVPTPSNRQVLATSLGGDVVLQLDFDASTGRLSPTPDDVAVRSQAGPRHLAFHPGHRLACLLNELDATLDLFRFDAERGRLGEHLQTVGFLPPDCTGEPWGADLHFTPDGRFLYASERRSSTLAGFRVDTDGGQLEFIGRVPTETQPRAFQITPDGRFLLSVGQLSHRLSVHGIDGSTGQLTTLGDFAVGQDPNWVEVI